MRRDCGAELSSKGVPVPDREALSSAGVGVESSAPALALARVLAWKTSSSSSSSSPKESLLFARGFFFFFFGGPSLPDVEFLPDCD
jgi:hypothetical protein